MKALKREKRLLRLVYLLCLLLFTTLGFLEQPFDKFALIMGVVLCVLIGYSHFVIRRFYPDGDKFILIFASVLAVGVATLYRINRVTAIKQLVWIALGIVSYILIVVILPDLRSFAKYKKVYMIITLMLMPLALLFGTELYGAKNWIIIGKVISFQPSEFGKIALVLYLASALAIYEDKKNFKEDFKELWQPALVAGFSMGCMVLQRDLGSALIFFGISITLLYVATSKKKYVFTALGLAAVGSVAGYSMFGHVRERVVIWLDPWKYKLGESYQIIEGMYSIAAGGLFGVGLGQGHFQNLPVKESDMIYAIICEEFGIIFAIGLMIIYFLLFYRGIRAAFVTNDKYSQLIAVGFSTMIACQTLVIIGGIFAVIPLTGITLPIISYGGSSVLTIFFALGILQKISEEA